MARKRSPDFLERMLQVATRVFARKGLVRARMSDVAQEMGVAQGSLYNYVESKEALFFLLVNAGLRTHSVELPEELPIRTPSSKTLLRRLKEQIEAAFTLPHLDAALERRQVTDARTELAEIIRELYLRTEETREPAAVIERSALDLPEMFQLFFVEVRRGLLERLTAYIRRRMASGHFKPVPDPAVAARLLLESVTFFGRHRYHDPDLPPGNDETVRETTVQLLVHALLASPPQTKRTEGRTK